MAACLTRRALLTLATGVACAAAVPVRGRAQMPRKLRVIVFPGGGNGWPIWVAQRQKFFAREGLEIELTPTPGSVYQMQHLLAGDFDIAHTAMDNVIAYTEGVGEVAPSGETSLVAILGGDNGFLHILARPQYATYSDLRGKRLGVDALTTGFAFVLRRMLETGGLGAGDYELVAVGAGAKRFQALVNDEIDGTISSTPFDVQGEAAGLHVFPAVIETLKHYQGYIAAVRQKWAAANPGDASAYIRAYRSALTWLYDPANRADAIALLMENAKMSQAAAEKTYPIMIDAKRGYDPAAAIDLAGVQTVLDLRKQYGAAQKPFGAPGKYVDLRYYS
jgi:ABC-type nitrate/sulfonate/bicarbonate transport system substrate-binding protein